VPGLATPRYLRISIIGAYVQDDWALPAEPDVEPGSTLGDVDGSDGNEGKLASLPSLDAALTHLWSTCCGCGAVGPTFEPDTSQFRARVGFAWDTFKNGKTAVRGASEWLMFYHALYDVTLNGRGAHS